MVPLSRSWKQIGRLAMQGLSRSKIALIVGYRGRTVDRALSSPELKAYMRKLEVAADREVVVMLAKRELRRILRCIPKG